jgi:hypothetical protein
MLLRILMLYLSFNAGFILGCYWAGSRHRHRASTGSDSAPGLTWASNYDRRPDLV